MRRVTSGKTIVLVCFGAIQFAVASMAEDTQPSPGQRAVTSAQETEALKKASAAMARTIADPDALAYLLPRTYRQQPTQWESTEKARYQELLSAQTYDILVVPFQVQSFALDRSTRSLMSVQLATAIAASGRTRVPDPYLVMGALGDGRRRFDVQDIHDLALKLRVRRIVWSHVGHDRKNSMLLRVQFEENVGNGTFAVEAMAEPHKFENIPFTDGFPPIEAFQKILPVVVEAWACPPPGLQSLLGKVGSTPTSCRQPRSP